MSLNNAHTQLVNILTTVAAIIAWVNTNFSQALTVLNGNRELKEFRDNELPALVFELGDGENEPLSKTYGEVKQQIKFGFVWFEKDFDAAFNQRKTLPDIVLKAIMSKNTLNATVSDAQLTSWSFAQSADDAYMHSARFDLDIEYGQAVTN